MYSKIISQDSLSNVVTLAEAKRQCRVMHDFDDDFIQSLIPVSAELAQSYSERALTPAVVTAVYESYASQVLLPYGEASAITELLVDGSASTNYDLDDITQKLTVGDSYSKLKVTYECGYTTIPTHIKHAILLTISTLYNNREDFVTGVTVATLPMTACKVIDAVKYYGI